MIQFILVQNRQGKTRLSKWYVPYSEPDKLAIKEQVHKVTSIRDQKNQSNFAEFRNDMLVYRRYAGLFFCMSVQPADNLMGALESIHLFVEILDQYFSNVCELDLVFQFYKVYQILDEVILAGELEDGSKETILNRLAVLDKLDG